MSENELREALIEVLMLYGIRGERLGSLRPGSVADALLPVGTAWAREFAAEELRAAATEVMQQHGTASLAAKRIRTRSIALDAGSGELARCYYVS